MTLLNLLRLSGVVCLGVVATACATGPIDNVECPNSTSFRRDVSPEVSVRDLTAQKRKGPLPGRFEEAIAEALSALIERKDLPEDRARPRIAGLSGGGQYGAYGAGFLKAWQQNGGRDVEFTVVSGISTGALQATLVFLGEESDSADLVEAYSIDDETDLARKRPSIFGIPLTNSIYSLAPTRARIGNYITAERIARVAEAAGENRKLLVGIVDARDGKFYAFDLTALAASDMDEEVKRQCYIEALMASAAVPVIFPPVYLDGRQYYDGGVRASVFLESTATALARLGADGPAKTEIYLVFNGYLRIEEEPKLENSILDTLLRTKDIAFDQIERYSVQSILRLSDRHDVKWKLIPWRRCLEAQESAPDEDVFNAPFMKCLIEEGNKAGAGPDPWLKP